MQTCPKCSAEFNDSGSKCPSCGLSVGDGSAETAILPQDAADDTPTRLETPSKRNNTPVTTTGGSRRFVAGTVLAGRYRIVGLIGKGGMGEVYKAEDLELEQTIALKFLPAELSKNEELLRRFRGEVRNARQVSHRNVCRVFDIGETEGLYYLTMEYIDGDDLSMLLKRIGRLPSDKAVEISREICMGLAAIHKAGILHRDLKPANIIIDSKGEARITDFGIAALEAEAQGPETRVGTPAYMSPEQGDGKEATQQSDIYSLGLLVYEIFTGKQAFEGDSIHELRIKHATTTPKNPSEIVAGIDPLVEKVIDRCLQKEPSQRPDSALRVAMSLPGGDPLQVALEAGETPTPEMVAAAPRKGSLSTAAAVGFLLAFIAVLCGVVVTQDVVRISAILPLERSAEILADRSKEFLKKVGHSEPSVGENYQFVADHDFTRYYRALENRDQYPPLKDMLRTGRASITFFVYRRSPASLNPGSALFVEENMPPMDREGMVNLKLDVRGRLVKFIAVPSMVRSVSESNNYDWTGFFEEAGLDIGLFESAEPKVTAPVFSEKARAFKGTFAEIPEIPITIETAEFEGKPVYFEIFAPWNSLSDDRVAPVAGDSAYGSIAELIFSILFWIVVIAAVFFGARNIRMGRVDVGGGLKLVLVLAGTYFVGYLYLLDRHAFIGGMPGAFLMNNILLSSASFSIATAALVGLIYVALEPIVRRRWPDLLISWSRLLAGGLRDPMVGRDVLIGGLLGSCWVFSVHLKFIIAQKLLGDQSELIVAYPAQAMSGMVSYVSFLATQVGDSVVSGFFAIFMILLLYLALGNKFLSVITVGLLLFVLLLVSVARNDPWFLLPFPFLHAGLLTAAIWRSGLLGVVTFWVFFFVVWTPAMTLDSSRFYFPQTVLTIIILLGMAIFATFTSVGGHGFKEAQQ